jgi:UDP-N-acetylmuramoylalanine--D-glutamate ligase
MDETTTIQPGMSVAVLGFGRSGQAITRYLSSCGARVMVSEARHQSELEKPEQALLLQCSAEFEGGGHTEQFLGRAEKIVVSPGIDPNSELMTRLRESGVEILGELALAAALFQAPVIAITGTNGKTTVTDLIGELLKAGGKEPFVGGNIGTPLGEYLLSPAGYDVVVLEVSSFQLEMSGLFVPQIALLLNLSPDHLDRHGSMEQYANAKMRIFNGGEAIGMAVMNGDDKLSLQFLHLAKRESFSLFGHRPDYSASIEENRIIIPGAGEDEAYDLAGSNLASLSGNLNAAAALLAVQSFGIDPGLKQEVLTNFLTGKHRMELVAEVAGITYINDSKATNTGAVASALQQFDRPVILIAGGKDKGDDYHLLRSVVKEHVKKLVLIGEAAPNLGESLADLVITDYPQTMEEAVASAIASAERGDTVLLSPACASFDMFSGYADRGECFSEVVRKLVHGKIREAL